MDTAGMLKRMGIDVWRQRVAAAAPAEAARAPAEAPPALAKAAPAAAAASPLPAATSPSSPSSPAPSPPAARPAAAEVPPFVVVCIKGESGMILAEAGSRALQLLATDVLVAATGQRGLDPRRLVFEWPQPALENSAVAAGKALGAFARKQIGENPDGPTLICERVREIVGTSGWHSSVIFVPALDGLARDGESKRKLWAKIRTSLH